MKEAEKEPEKERIFQGKYFTIVLKTSETEMNKKFTLMAQEFFDRYYKG
jgi:hypothetical protein